MAPLPGYQFRRLLRAMDADAFERFVADAWRSRGWTVERRDGALSGWAVRRTPQWSDLRPAAVAVALAVLLVAAADGGGNRAVSVLVTAGGTVHEVRGERDVPGTDRSVVVTLEYAYGPVDVTPPHWLGNDSATVGRDLSLGSR